VRGAGFRSRGPAVDHRDTGASTSTSVCSPYIAVDLVEVTVGVLDAHGIEGA
jgi:hypothetical protein